MPGIAAFVIFLYAGSISELVVGSDASTLFLVLGLGAHKSCWSCAACALCRHHRGTDAHESLTVATP